MPVCVYLCLKGGSQEADTWVPDIPHKTKGKHFAPTDFAPRFKFHLVQHDKPWVPGGAGLPPLPLGSAPAQPE